MVLRDEDDRTDLPDENARVDGYKDCKCVVVHNLMDVARMVGRKIDSEHLKN